MDFELNVELAPDAPVIETVIGGEDSPSILRSLSPVRHGVAHDVKAEFGRCSLFDFLVTSIDTEPFEVPAKPYLEEVLVGIYGAAHAGRGSSKDSRDKPCREARAHRSQLKRTLAMDCMRDVVRALFWIIIGIVTKRVVADAIAELRRLLANSWSLVVCEVRRAAHDEATQDWILQALPVILVQCIYRLMVDAFPDDRSQLIHYEEKLLDKIAHIVIYEVCGFQLNSRTCLEGRRKLFRKDLLENPFLNQHDTLKSQMRREALENRSSKPSPLIFGETDALPLEETQLEHVMLERQQEHVPQDLSVDRYMGISEKGEEIFERHLGELLPRIAPVVTQSIESRRTPHSSRKSRFQTDREEERRKRETKEVEKRRREESLIAFCEEPLPAKFCQRQLNTSWVSPIVDVLVPGEKERRVLRKGVADSRQLKMVLPPLKQSKSEPLLQNKTCLAQKLPKIQGNDDSDGSLGHAAWYGPRKSLRREIALEPPASLKSGVVIDRLKDHLVNYNSRSFGVYSKEHDITSGQKKQRMDPAAMRRAESAYITSMHSLVGPPSQPALKLTNTVSQKATQPKVNLKI
mmetsp:Transcript_6629/g.10641  ORF Transcript_6629/g.10641 Transcript_6629/m.10641 type:complete len:576 (-) Transcript_6629:148-1875(-)